MIAILGFLCWILTLIGAFLTFDRLLFIEYSSYRRNWEKDGKPHGFFWTPTEVRHSGFWQFNLSTIAHMRLRFDWLFVTPSWIQGSPEARFWLYAWRGLFILALGFIPLAVLASALL